MDEKQIVQLPDEICEFIDSCMEKPHPQSYLIAVLHKVQEYFGYLADPILDEVAYRMQIPTANVSGTATFYHFFRQQPKGKYAISVCLGTACFVNGADEVLIAFQDELGIQLGETTTDGQFSIESSRCVGVCALAPVVLVNEQVYSNVTPQQVPDILNSVRAAR